MSKGKSVKNVDNLTNYMEYINNSSCIIKFTAPWCGPCKRISPEYEILAKQYNEKINFLEVNVDTANKITNYENIQSIPLFLFYNKGYKLENYQMQGSDISTLNKNVNMFLENFIEDQKPNIEPHREPEFISGDNQSKTISKQDNSEKIMTEKSNETE